MPYLEGQMLEEVRGAVVLVSLGTGSRVDPNANGRGLGPWRMLSGDLESFKLDSCHTMVHVEAR